MKNCEYYAKEIAEAMISNSCAFIEKHLYKGKDCSYNIRCDECQKRFEQWLLEDYKEPEIDWSKVPVDTPVLVRYYDDREWLERHFVCYMPCTNLPFVAFTTGKTREKAQNVQWWSQCKLADGVDPTPYLKEV